MGAAGQKEALEEALEALGRHPAAFLPTPWCWAEGGQQSPLSRLGHSETVLWEKLLCPAGFDVGLDPRGWWWWCRRKIKPKRWISVLREHHEPPHCWEWANSLPEECGREAEPSCPKAEVPRAGFGDMGVISGCLRSSVTMASTPRIPLQPNGKGEGQGGGASFGNNERATLALPPPDKATSE